MEGPDAGALRGGDSYEHGAHLAAPVVPVRPGHAGGGQGDVTAQHPPGPLGHGGGHLSGHRPEPVQHVLWDPQDAGLDFVCVGHNPSPEGGGSPGDIGQPLGHQAAGAALRRTDSQAFLLQITDHNILQRGHIHPVHLVAEQLPHLGHGGLEECLGFLIRRRLGGDPQLALPLLGVGGQGGVGHGVHLVPQLGFHGGLPDAEQLDGVGCDDPLGQGQQVGLRPVLEHGPALAGGAREHDDVDPIRFKGAAGGGAPVVGQDGAPLGEHGLLEVVVRHGPADTIKIGADALRRTLVKDQLLAKGLGQHVFGQIVAGGPQASGGDDDVRPLFGQGHRFLGPLEVIPHHGVPKDVQPQLAQPLGQHLGVSVGDISQKQLGPHR